MESEEGQGDVCVSSGCHFVLLIAIVHLLCSVSCICSVQLGGPVSLRSGHPCPSIAGQVALTKISLLEGGGGGQMLEAMALLHLVGTLATNSFAINQITFFRSPLASYIAHVCTIFGSNLFTRWLK
jgi:hypothetical protein